MRAACTIFALCVALVSARSAAADGASAPTATAAALAPLEIESLELAASPLGPAVEGGVFIVPQRVHVRLRVRGFSHPKDDPAGFALAIGLAVRAPGAEGPVPAVGTERGRDPFGARSLPLALSFPLAGAVAAGGREVTVAVTDEPTGRRAERRVPLEARAPAGLTILAAYFTAGGDPARERPAAFVVGEDVTLAFAVAGLAPRAGRVRARIDLAILDEADAVVGERLGLSELEAEERPGVAALDGAAAITATRAGRFRVRLRAHDPNADATVALERAIEVREPPVR